MSNSVSQKFPSVRLEEMAFAMALFVGAGSGEVLLTQNSGSPAAQSEQLRAHHNFISWSAHNSIALPHENLATSHISLFAAFLALWHHYNCDDHQSSICARVLGFYYLMERSRGAVLADWVEESSGHPEVVLLHPAIIETISTMEIDDTGCFSEILFLEALASAAARERFVNKSELSGSIATLIKPETGIELTQVSPANSNVLVNE